MSAAAGPTHAFSLATELPAGVTVLEASAGTGKTYTIATLAAKFVAEGMPLERLLLITFTRAATGELRERVRERLVTTERGLAQVLAGFPPQGEDELVELLASAAAGRVAERHEHLARALADFDAATIETTHGFCQRMLEDLGTLADLDPDAQFVDEIDALTGEVIDDLYVRLFHRDRGGLWLTRGQAGAVARIAIDNPTAVIHPADAPARSEAALRTWLAGAARDELDARKRRLGLLTHDDQLTRLLGTLSGPNGALAAAALRRRFSVVLVDEFQDTDPIQWEIVSRAFGTGATRLVLIGDPKQAIYAFRGADVYSYLEAVGEASLRATLAVNYRSDAGLLRGLDAVFGHARLGHPGIVYGPVNAAPPALGPRLHGAPSAAPLRLRMLTAGEPQVALTRGGLPQAGSAREFIARDLAADVVALLESGAVVDRRAVGDEPSSSRVRPGDIAVLVRSHSHAALIRDELDARAVPVVVGGGKSVFTTPGARAWKALLEALERPSDRRRASAAALTPLLGWSATRLALADEQALEGLHQRLHGWARTLRERGMAALATTLMNGERVPERLLARLDGEREITDLQHVAELLHRAVAADRLGVAALAGWLRERITQAERERDDERTRRLDTDAAAVQVITFHSSKGLEFPVVYCPFLWDAGWRREASDPVYFHDPDDGFRRSIDVAGGGPEYERHRDQHRAEERGEDLRLAYVALTRARHQAVIWWAGTASAKSSPLGRLLFAQDAEGNVADAARFTVTDERARERFAAVARLSEGAVAVETARIAADAGDYSGEPEAHAALAVARLGRRIDRSWRRTSYSAITAAAHDALGLVGSEPEESGGAGDDDEPAGAELGGFEVLEPGATLSPDDAVLSSTPLPLASMAMGPRLGTAVHRALELVEFDATDLTGDLTAVLADVVQRSPSLLGCSVPVAADGLALGLATPLRAADGSSFALSGVARADRLDELTFELPLAGGDRPRGEVELSAVARTLDRWLGGDDPLVGYAQRLRDPTLVGRFRGFLTGTIDLVLRVRSGAGTRYAIIDYKTNWLAPPGVELSAWHYRPEALAAEMQRSHYALQALLYAVALHRYLRWRLRGYEPERDLGGVHYLFLRGMLGAAGPLAGGAATGVLDWHPPAGLIVELSEVLSGRQS
jgi:exodeoxyribonuclease V beta subunit